MDIEHVQFCLLNYVTCLVVPALVIYTLSGDLSDMVGVTERSIDGPHHAFYGELQYSRLSLSRNRRDHHEHFEISVLRHIRFVILRKKFEQPNFTNDYVI